MVLHRGDLVRQIAVTALDGSRFDYSEIWQRKNLLLVTLAETASSDAGAYASELTSRMDELTALETKCVITSDDVLDMPKVGVVIADRWGEIYFVEAGLRVTDLPTAAEILEWLRDIEHECPECQGEAR
jgi:hypothetical protein